MLIVLQALLFFVAIAFLIFGILAWVDKQYNEIKYGSKYNDFGCKEDFSSRNEYNEKDPWSMFRETK